MKSIHAPSGASFLKELKAAQEVIDRFFGGPVRVIDWTLVSDEDDVLSLAAVLRRIPQLIETIEWAESEIAKLKPLAKTEREEAKLGELMAVNLAKNYLAAILSKLEGKKDE